MDTKISTFKADTASAERHLDLTDNDGDSIHTWYDRVNNQIIVDSVAVEGGFMLLTGQIMNTNSTGGHLKTVDGYGNITIINNTSYDVAVNRLDAGGTGIEGTIGIVDTVDTFDKTTGKPISGANARVTTYTRVGNDIQVYVDGELTSTQADSRVLTGGYQPKAGERYVDASGTTTGFRTVKEYVTASFWGIDWLAPDRGVKPDKTTVTHAESPLKLDAGTYVAWNSSTQNVITTKTTVELSKLTGIGQYPRALGGGYSLRPIITRSRNTIRPKINTSPSA